RALPRPGGVPACGPHAHADRTARERAGGGRDVRGRDPGRRRPRARALPRGPGARRRAPRVVVVRRSRDAALHRVLRPRLDRRTVAGTRLRRPRRRPRAVRSRRLPATRADRSRDPRDHRAVPARGVAMSTTAIWFWKEWRSQRGLLAAALGLTLAVLVLAWL